MSLQSSRSASAVRVQRGCGETLEAYIARVAEAGPEAIDHRLEELQREWSVGRATKAAAGVLLLGGVVAAVAGRRRSSLLLPLAASGFLTQYLFARDSWLSQVFCQFGCRTSAAIEQERIALRTLRGDFRTLPTVQDIESHHDIARFEGEGGLAYEPEERKLDPKEAAHQVLQATQ